MTIKIDNSVIKTLNREKGAHPFRLAKRDGVYYIANDDEPAAAIVWTHEGARWIKTALKNHLSMIEYVKGE